MIALRNRNQAHSRTPFVLSLLLLLLLLTPFDSQGATATHAAGEEAGSFPPALESYEDSHMTGVLEVLKHRVQAEPFNLWASLLFLGAVIHTFLNHKFRHWSHVLEDRHQDRLREALGENPEAAEEMGHTCMSARLFHFLGEVEAIFGIWVVPLFIVMISKVGWQPTLNYLDHRVSYQEPMFVVVIMAISATRPILRLAEQCMQFFARLGGGGAGAWWLAILTVGPLLGSFITEPAAMTISALLLGRQFYSRKPSLTFSYATLGLLFVNISVGGVLTHFAAPPVLMVASTWDWSTPFMFKHFGWIAMVGIAITNAGYYLVFRKQLARLGPAVEDSPAAGEKATRKGSIPLWVTLSHVLFMAWVVTCAHYTALMIGGFLFFLAFLEVTSDYQSNFQLRSPILVGFFLAGLVIHGGLQQWWIAPVLSRLSEVPLMLGAIGLTAFNDNAAITYLSTLVPGLTEELKFAVVSGAVTGGGLTVIANAPNPAGQSILNHFFPEGIAPLGLLAGAIPATIVMALCFLVLQ